MKVESQENRNLHNFGASDKMFNLRNEEKDNLLVCRVQYFDAF